MRTGIDGWWFCRCLEARSGDAAAISFIAQIYSLLIDLKGKKALAIGHCDVSDAEKGLEPSIKIPSLSMNEMVQDALVSFCCLRFLGERRKQALIR